MSEEIPPKLNENKGLWASLKSMAFSGSDEPTLKESLEGVIEDHDDESGLGQLGNEERSMLFNVLSYGDKRIDDVMVPRVDIVAVDAGLTFENLLSVFAEASHSRLPVYRENLDEIIGMVHVKDLVRGIQKRTVEGVSPERELETFMREVLFVAPSMRLMDLLAKMRSKRTHMAIVVDEYGGTDGLVTIEDLLEQIIGDIEDEHDEEERPVLHSVKEGVFDAGARLPIEELEKVMACSFSDENGEDSIDTLGGLVAGLAGRVPQIGEIIEHAEGYRFEVLDADPRRLKKIRIYSPNA